MSKPQLLPNQIATYPPRREYSSELDRAAAFRQHEAAHLETAERAVRLVEAEAYSHVARYAWPEDAGPPPQIVYGSLTTTYLDIPEPSGDRTQRITIHSDGSLIRESIEWPYTPQDCDMWRTVKVWFDKRGGGSFTNPEGAGTADLMVEWQRTRPQTGKGDWEIDDLSQFLIK